MSGRPVATIVEASQTHPTEDVTTMLNQFHLVTDIAADHRRSLLAEAAAHRLAKAAREATTPSTARSGGRTWLRRLRAPARARTT
jgi:hypothetical protein